MNTHTLIAAAVPEHLKPSIPGLVSHGLCAVTGEVTKCLQRKKVISDANCDAYLFAAPSSNLVSVDVFTAWNFGELKEGKKRQTCPERQSCWWCDGTEFRQIGKAEMRPIVLAGSPSTPWAMWVTTSYKKHGALRAPTNFTPRGIIGFDELRVNCSDDEVVIEHWKRLRDAQDNGIPRPLIESLDIAPGMLIRKIDWRVWRNFEAWARPRKESPLYKFMTYLLPSQEELKNASDATEQNQ